MSTLDTAVLWSATTLAFDEKKLGSAGLSVRQRKLLGLLSTPASVAQLAPSIAMPEIEVQAALERFAKLGLAQSDAAVPFNPMQARSQVLASGATEGVESSSRMPVMIGVAVAVLALMAASAWLLRGGTPAASTSTPNPKNSLPAPRAAADIRPSESTDTLAPSPNGAAKSGAPSAASTNPVAIAPPVRTSAATVIAAAEIPTAATKAAPTVAPLSVAGRAIELPTPAVANTTPSAPSVAAPAATAAPAEASVAAVPAPAPVAIAAAAPVAPPPATVAATPPAATPIPVAAAPRPAPAREIKLVNRIEPTFPRGVDTERGSVRARLQVDAKGVVTNVEIVESVPPRVFDRTVRNALQQWRYEPTGEPFSTAAEISFAR